MTDLTIWIPAEISALGLPPTPGRTEWFQHWAAGEGTGAAFNPLATTLSGLEDQANPYWNSFGPNGQYHVRNYKDMASGVAQTAATIRQANFALILQCLQYQRVVAGVADVMRSTWGTVAFANELVAGFVPSGWTSDYVSTGPPPNPLDDLVLALFAGSEQHDAAGVPFPRATRLAYAYGVMADIAAGNAPSVKELAASALALAATKAPATVPDHGHGKGGVVQ